MILYFPDFGSFGCFSYFQDPLFFYYLWFVVFFLRLSAIDHMSALLWFLIWLKLVLSVVHYDVSVPFSFKVIMDTRNEIQYFLITITTMTIIMSLFFLLRQVCGSLVLVVLAFHSHATYVIVFLLDA